MSGDDGSDEPETGGRDDESGVGPEHDERGDGSGNESDETGGDGGNGDGDGPDLAWETLGAQTVYTCEGFDVVNEDVQFPDDTVAAYDYVAEGDSVVVLPFTADGEVVVVEEWRHPVRRVNRGLPAGGLEPGDDDPAAAVARELEEETGYEPGEVEHLTSAEPANGLLDSTFHYFVARDCTPSGVRDLDYNESIAVETATFDELVDAAREDRLRDGRSMLAVLYYELFERAGNR